MDGRSSGGNLETWHWTSYFIVNVVRWLSLMGLSDYPCSPSSARTRVPPYSEICKKLNAASHRMFLEKTSMMSHRRTSELAKATTLTRLRQESILSTFPAEVWKSHWLALHKARRTDRFLKDTAIILFGQLV